MSSNAGNLERYLTFWNQDRGNASLCLDIMSLYASSGNVVEADNFLLQLSPELQVHPKLLWLQAKCYVNTGRFDEALVRFESLPEDEELSKTYGICICLFFKQEFEKASSLIKKAMESSDKPLAAEFILLFAKAQYHLSNLDIAIQYSEQLLETHYIQNAELLGLLAMLHLDKNDIQQSNEYADKALSLDSNHHDALLAKASCLIFVQNGKDSEKFAKSGVSLYPNSGRVWSVLSQAQMLNQNLPEAYASVCKAVSLMSEHIGTWHVKGWLELTREQLDDAYKSFNNALSLNRNFADSHGGLAVVAFHQNDYPEAEKLAKIALRLDPNSFSARYAMSLLAKHAGKLEESDRIMSDILQQESHLLGANYSQLISLLNK